MRGGSGTESFEVVAAFQDADQAPARVPGGDLQHDRCHLTEVGVLEQEPAQRIAAARIKAGGDEYEIGPELVHGRDQFLAERPQHLCMTGPGGQGPIQSCAAAAAGPGFVRSPGAWIPGPLVYREEEHAAVGVEGVLRAVAVMDVPVDDRHLLHTMRFLRVARCDGHAVVDAKAHPSRGGGVVARRANSRERVPDFAAKDRVYRRQHSAGSAQRRDECVLAQRRVACAQPIGTARHVVPDHLQVIPSVDKVQVVLGGIACWDSRKRRQQTGALECVVEIFVTVRRFRMAGPRIVFRAKGIQDEPRGGRLQHYWYFDKLVRELRRAGPRKGIRARCPMATLAPPPDTGILISRPRFRPVRKTRRMHPVEFFVDLASQTLANLRRNKLRSFLTLFGIAWGIASLVLLSALSDGFRQGQRKNMGQIGDNIVFLWGGVTELQAGGKRAGRRVMLDRRDVDLIRSQCPAVSVVSAEMKTQGVPARSAFNSGRFLTVGVSPEYLAMRNLPVSQGRTISAGDLKEGQRVAVLGSSVRKQLFEKRNAIGEQIFVNNYPYQVVGLMPEKEQNSSYDGWDNDKILVPETALLRDMPPSREVYAENRVWGLLYRPVSVDRWEEAQAQVRTVLGRVKGFDPKDDGALRIWDTVEGAKMFDSIFNAGEIFLAVISLVTLSLGGVGVMNTMMMAVAERTNEIGLKKAVGATRGRILTDFLMEGIFLALLAGGAGLMLTLILSSLVNSLPMPAMFSGLPVNWKMLVFAATALGLVAVFSSLPPARRAAELTPVEALRHER